MSKKKKGLVKDNKKIFRDKKSVLRLVIGIIISLMLLYVIIPPKFSITNEIAPEELTYEETSLFVSMNKPIGLTLFEGNKLDRYMRDYVFGTYCLDPTIFDYIYTPKESGYLVTLMPKHHNMHRECYMTDYYKADLEIEEYVHQFLIESRAIYILDIKGNKEDFSEVLRTGAGVDYQYATMFWILLQEKGIKSKIEYIDGVYYNVIGEKKFDIGNNIYH